MFSFVFSTAPPVSMTTLFVVRRIYFLRGHLKFRNLDELNFRFDGWTRKESVRAFALGSCLGDELSVDMRLGVKKGTLFEIWAL